MTTALDITAGMTKPSRTGLDFERQQIVSPGPTEVDGRDWDAAACGSLDEAKAGIHHKG